MDDNSLAKIPDFHTRARSWQQAVRSLLPSRLPTEACGCKPALQVPRCQRSVDGGLCLCLSGMATLKLLNMCTESSVTKMVLLRIFWLGAVPLSSDFLRPAPVQSGASMNRKVLQALEQGPGDLQTPKPSRNS